MSCGGLIVPGSLILACASLLSEAYFQPLAASPMCASVSWHFLATRVRKELREELHGP